MWNLSQLLLRDGTTMNDLFLQTASSQRLNNILVLLRYPAILHAHIPETGLDACPHLGMLQ
jgi:hypothetical protein